MMGAMVWARDQYDDDEDVQFIGDCIASAGLDPFFVMPMLRPMVWQLRALHRKADEKELTPNGKARLMNSVASALLTLWWRMEARDD